VLIGSPLESLGKQLASIVASLNAQTGPLGRPELVLKAADEAAKLFQGSAKAMPSREEAYAAALAFVRGEQLDERQRHFLAGALAERVREAGGRSPLAHDNLRKLLETYGREAARGDLWRLTWFGLLSSYFAFDPLSISRDENSNALSGWKRLREFIRLSWPVIDKQSTLIAVPDWVIVLREDPELLGESAASRYGLDYLRGDESGVKRITDDLGIPESSWFWHALVLSAIERSAGQSDRAFKESIPQMLSLLNRRPAYRDDALVVILTRYHRCSEPTLHAELRDYVVRKDVWRNPKLRDAGLATSWTRVSDDVWRMVLGWVNKANLRDFFAVLAAQGNSDHGRLEFWSRYMEQISWTRLIFSNETQYLARRNEAIRNLIAREEGSYATMSLNGQVDAFMMQLGNYIVVEFSRQPNAAYVYKADQLPYQPYATAYTGTTSDLKYGLHGTKAARITHRRGWEAEAGVELGRLGIHPDQPPSGSRGSGTQVPSRTVTRRAAGKDRANESATHALLAAAPAGATFTMAELSALVARYPGARIDVRWTTTTKRSLWVEDQSQNPVLAAALKAMGFRWATIRQAHYFPEKG
jgi:hypothetical protein